LNLVIEMHAHHFAQLVGLHVRPQALDATCQLDHVTDVLLDAVGIDEERGGGDPGDVFDGVPGHGGRLSQLSTIQRSNDPTIQRSKGNRSTNGVKSSQQAD
jgi:hypothetical protein